MISFAYLFTVFLKCPFSRLDSFRKPVLYRILSNTFLTYVPIRILNISINNIKIILFRKIYLPSEFPHSFHYLFIVQQIVTRPDSGLISYKHNTYKHNTT